MADARSAVADALASSGELAETVRVEVSYEVINLLSAQLYASPLKAIEELVVNAWDADAKVCRVCVPDQEEVDRGRVVVFDNGHGMSSPELRDLWHVGVSHKREDAWRSRANRLQIGKFGIGKLASYVLARRVTYVSRTSEGILGLSLDFEAFSNSTRTDGTIDPVLLDMVRVPDADALLGDARLEAALACVSLGAADLIGDSYPTWTLVVLEELKEKAKSIRLGRLNWVLRTAMPLAADFELSLNGEVVASAKEDFDWLAEFSVAAIEEDRLKSLATGEDAEDWRVDNDHLVSAHFPSGVHGRVGVARRSLYASNSKSQDLGRSHGFFVKVRGRLINEADPLFGAKPRSFSTWNRFFADINADDLDTYLTAPRDDVEQVVAKSVLRRLMLELFNQAREAAEAEIKRILEVEKRKQEGARDFVNPRLIERPIADALVSHREDWSDPAEWMYLKPEVGDEALQGLVDTLYAEEPPRRQYIYRYTSRGRQGRLVEFDPGQSVFVVNEVHDLVVEYRDSPASRRLLEVVVTAEALLEVYLRELRVDSFVVVQLLERRDELLRSLTRDELYSLRSIAQALRDARGDKYDLEVAIVAAVRALGFVSRHIAGAGEPDGAARYAAESPAASFTLEAKSSADVPTLPQLDFAGLRSHWEAHDAQGCMLVAPSYPGSERGDDSEVATRAGQQHVSCWTIDQLAQVVESAEARHISADDIERMVLTTYTPAQVTAALDRLLHRPEWSQRTLYGAVLNALETLEPRLRDAPRDISMLATTISLSDGFVGVSREDVRSAAEELSRASRGMLYVDGDQLTVRGALEELRRRVAELTGGETEPRRRGRFRRRDVEDHSATNGADGDD